MIVPHGPLHYVPFHALVTALDVTEPTNSRYLLDHFTVSYLPGAAFLTPVAAPAGNHRGTLIALGHSYGAGYPTRWQRPR